MEDIQTRFEQAAREVQQLSKKPDSNTLLRLYALYKQSTLGDTRGKRPGFTDPVGRAKFDAWSQVMGIPQEEAMRAYIQLVEKLKR